jgi:uncharacterized protein (DUF1800 family)
MIPLLSFTSYQWVSSVQTQSQQTQSVIALYRLGFGASEPDLRNVGSDAKRWLTDQLDPTHIRSITRHSAFADLPSSEITGAVFPSMLARAGFLDGMGQGTRNPAGILSRSGDMPSMNRPSGGAGDHRIGDVMSEGMRSVPGGISGSGDTPSMNRTSAVMNENRAINRMMPYLAAELEARMKFATVTSTPFLERLVWFWSNHLTVSAQRLGLHPLVGPFEREAIRPHVLGNFKDMLLASIRHPAMQVYLDNFRSVGPNTKAVGSGFGPMKRTGVNENLARELLELHSIGDRAVYSQADVGEFALALTGWGLSARGTQFVFSADAHEAGARTVLGKRYSQEGAAQAEAIIADLVLHPATARHLAQKLLAHFGSDAASNDDIALVAKAYLDSRGDLRQTALALINTKAVWRSDARGRAKRPDEFMVTAWRTLGISAAKGDAIHSELDSLGQVTWFAPSPQGWSDRSAMWLGPDQLLARIEWCEKLASKLPSSVDARSLAARSFSTLLSEHTQQEINRAESGAQALVLFLASPEFLRT